MGGYVLGIDAGTESIRTGVYDASGTCLAYGTSDNENIHRHPGWAEQRVTDWETSLIESIRRALDRSGVDPSDIEGIGLDGTSCTVVFLDGNGRPLRDAIMWMDIRASQEAQEIAATGDAALKYVGYGNVSPEWFPCKVLWVKRHEPDLYHKASTIFEQTDWLVYELSGGEITANINTATIRWFYNNREQGFPASLYNRIDLHDVFEKLPQRVTEIGEVAGKLGKEVAEKTGLTAGIPIGGGGADAYIGVIGINALEAGQLALITGSSQLHIGVSDRELHAPGLFGSFPDAILPGREIVEAGQISTGSVLSWFMNNFVGKEIAEEAGRQGISSYDLLSRRAEELPPGSDGLLVMEHWQGNRTPWVDPKSRGVIRGLTLGHTPTHVYRAIMEGVAYGTAVIIKRMEEENLDIEQIIACGGATQSDLWMQIHSDVSGKPISIPKEQQAVALGSGIIGTVAAGWYSDVRNATQQMVRVDRVVEPNERNTAFYQEFLRQYEATYESLKQESAKLVDYVES